ncbi:MAG TPA: bifunctional hydroxymethylpyrimidine kinase/phosphomethylpyrimidine kinase [Spirochaetia bacterium]|nr:bifunctional hydroxymethylpyrimidine kinase/phosphomethylpyrimidine kinase [Spirochaetia bacterium]
MGSLQMKKALTIAGSDSGGGAGIQADLKTFAALGVFGTCAITALTAQNTVGVVGVYAIPPDFVALQIDAVVKDIGADAVKIGMLSNSRIIQIVAAKVVEHALQPLVVDPVMVAKSGDALLEPDARDALVSTLLPLAAVVTPNLPEAEVLCGFSISDMEGMRRAAREILARGPRCVVVKGGHLLGTGFSTDLYYDGERFEELSEVRFDTRNTHGTGCTFASAIAARLALGDDMLDAVRAAKRYVSGILAASSGLQIGHGHGPMNHMGLLLTQPPLTSR